MIQTTPLQKVDNVSRSIKDFFLEWTEIKDKILTAQIGAAQKVLYEKIDVTIAGLNLKVVSMDEQMLKHLAEMEKQFAVVTECYQALQSLQTEKSK